MFTTFFKKTAYFEKHSEEFEEIYERIKDYIFIKEGGRKIDYGENGGTNGYHTSNLTQLDAQKIKTLLIKKGLEVENQRWVKHDDTHFTLKVASQKTAKEEFEIEGINFSLVYGEFSSFLELSNKYLAEAEKHASNETQSSMLKKYIEHFEKGGMQEHRESQILWIQDRQPTIETNIGFVETYLDPIKVKGEYMGLVAIKHQKESQLLVKLVEYAQKALTYLPWAENFEKPEFKKPDFTSI